MSVLPLWRRVKAMVPPLPNGVGVGPGVAGEAASLPPMWESLALAAMAVGAASGDSTTVGITIDRYSATVSRTSTRRLPSTSKTSRRTPRGCSVIGRPTSSGRRSQRQECTTPPQDRCSTLSCFPVPLPSRFSGVSVLGARDSPCSASARSALSDIPNKYTSPGSLVKPAALDYTWVYTRATGRKHKLCLR
jgi:hypothetical protein